MSDKALHITQVLTSSGEKMLELTSPYNPDMVKRCRLLGGGWNKTQKKWYFAPSQLMALSDACFEVYGEHPSVISDEQGNVVTVNNSFELAIDYVNGIKAHAKNLTTDERNQILMALLDALQ